MSRHKTLKCCFSFFLLLSILASYKPLNSQDKCKEIVKAMERAYSSPDSIRARIPQNEGDALFHNTLLQARVKFHQGYPEVSRNILSAQINSIDDVATACLTGWYWYYYGEALEYTNAMDSALLMYNTAYTFARENALPILEAQYYNKLGDIQYSIDRLELANEYYESALQICNGTKTLQICTEAILNKAKVDWKLYNKVLSDKTFQTLKDELKRRKHYRVLLYLLNLRIRQVIDNQNIAEVYDLIQEIDHITSHSISNPLVDYNQYISHAQLLAVEGQCSLATQQAQQAYDVALISGIIQHEREALLVQIQCDLENKDWEAAFTKQNEVNRIEQKLNAQSRVQPIHDYDEILIKTLQETRIKNLEADNSSLLSQRNRVRLLSGFLLIALLALLAFYIYNMRINKDLAVSNKKLEHLYQSNAQLLSLISHDVKNHLLSFRQIGKKINYLLKENRQEDLNQFTSGLDHTYSNLSKIFSDVLLWLKSETPHQSQAVSLPFAQRVNAVLDVYATAIVTKKLTIIKDFDNGLMLKLEPILLESILNNLVSNCIKFSHSGGKISIRAKVIDSAFVLEVEDDGVGIEQHVIDNLLANQSLQSSAGTQGEKGQGIGLSILKNLIASYSGMLHIESLDGQGCRATVTIPHSKN